MGDTRKIIGAIIGILCFIAMIAGLTYALYAFTASNNSVINGKHECIRINYSKGTDINVSEMEFATSYSEAEANTVVTFYNDGSCNANSVGTISIYTNNTTSNVLYNGVTEGGNTYYPLKYLIKNNATNATYSGFIQNSGDTNVDVGVLSNSSNTYSVYLWIEKDSGNHITDEVVSEAVYSGYIHASARQTSTFK